MVFSIFIFPSQKPKNITWIQRPESSHQPNWPKLDPTTKTQPITKKAAMYLWVCEWEPPTQTPIHFFFGSKYQSQVQQIRKTKQAQQKFPKQTETQRLELWLIGEDVVQDRGNPVEQSGDPSGQWWRRGLGVSLLGQEAQAPPLW